MKCLFFPLLILFALQADAQRQDLNTLSEDERRAIVKEALSDLKDGKATLIVRLPSNHKKMRELKRLADSDKLSPQKSAQMQEMLAATASITPAFNGRLMTAFEENYDFSPVLFMLDTASVSLKNGVRRGIFLDKNIENNPDIKLTTDKYYLLAVDYEGFPKAMNIVDYDMLNAAAEKLPRPFPQDARASFWLNFSLIFSGDSAEKQKKAMTKMTAKYNKKLTKAYERFIK